ncbi:TetR/AcrR family transcriptional regulator [Xanthomonas hyacinthi]|uniref:TetR/AcrR family transcriptional regulator n=1 Tax=Xanthomonas hyacinthi TaxID=56455 RepID=UPI001AD7CC12|nr:TetR/AcrR family transcriptional regulator [Xanthomonas hyacinthi]
MFDTEAVLDSAAAEFRVHGFADTSTEKLCEAAGVRRSSLYNAFTSKEELFVQALRRYTEVTTLRQEEVLTAAELDGGTRLWRIVEMVVEEEWAACKKGHAAGCMTVHTFMSPHVRQSDSRVQSILSQDLDHRLSLLTEAARVGQLDGSVRPESSPEDVAMLIVTVVSGLRVTAQTGAEPAQLLRIARMSLGATLA